MAIKIIEPVNYYELEERINEIVDSPPEMKKIRIKGICKDFSLGINIIKREIKAREKKKIENIKNEKKVKKYYDLPVWKDKSKCPMCNSTLVKKWEGLVCRNNCPLNFKLGKGWVYLQKYSGWSNSRYTINNILGTTARNRFQYRFANLKKKVLIRDDYTCRSCGYSIGCNWAYGVGNNLEVHHIIPASEEMALYLDVDNCITLCKSCHKKIHSNDKYKFGCDKNER